MKIAKSGYYSGDPEKVLAAPVGVVLSILHYELFETDLQKEYSKIAEDEQNENR